MIFDKTTVRLFGNFPREVGNPVRSVVRRLEDLENFVTINNGQHECFVGVYPQYGKVVDKITLDADDKGSLHESKQLYKNLRSKNYLVIPVVSGKKGYHLHALMKPSIHDNNKQLLMNATLKLLEDSFGINVKGELNCKTFDTTTFGDIRQLIRIPNTLRPPENRNLCTYLPPDEFLDMTEEDIALHMKTIHYYKYSGVLLPSIDEFEETNVKCNSTKKIEVNDEIPISEGKNVLRPCLYRHMIRPEPPHVVRVAATIDLLSFFTENEILKLYSKLGWIDFNPRITEYQIRTCKNLRSYSCKTLRKKGIPRECCVD
jgi:hypothetical protein